jgi:hypothetical protein
MLSFDLALAACKLPPSVAEDHTAAAVVLRNVVQDSSAESIAAALKLREFLHPQMPLSKQVIIDPRAASLRGALSSEMLKVLIMDVILNNSASAPDDNTNSILARGGRLTPSFKLFCISTSWGGCFLCRLYMQRCLLLRALSQLDFSLCDGFHPNLGVPLAAFSLYMSILSKSLGIEDGSIAYWYVCHFYCDK